MNLHLIPSRRETKILLSVWNLDLEAQILKKCRSISVGHASVTDIAPICIQRVSINFYLFILKNISDTRKPLPFSIFRKILILFIFNCSICFYLFQIWFFNTFSLCTFKNQPYKSKERDLSCVWPIFFWA